MFYFRVHDGHSCREITPHPTVRKGESFILCKMFARIILINFSFILAFALVFEFVKDFRCADCAVAQRG